MFNLEITWPYGNYFYLKFKVFNDVLSVSNDQIFLHLPGSEDGKIHVWNAESGMKVALLDGKHTGPICCLQFNPKYMTFASACSNMVSITPGEAFFSHFYCCD